MCSNSGKAVWEMFKYWSVHWLWVLIMLKMFWNCQNLWVWISSNCHIFHITMPTERKIISCSLGNNCFEFDSRVALVRNVSVSPAADIITYFKLGNNCCLRNYWSISNIFKDSNKIWTNDQIQRSENRHHVHRKLCFSSMSTSHCHVTAFLQQQQQKRKLSTQSCMSQY